MYDRLMRKPKPVPEKVNVTSTNTTDLNATGDGNNTIHVNITSDENSTVPDAEEGEPTEEKKEETKEAGEDEL